MIRLLIADDQRTVRDGLALLVGTLDGVEVVGAVADGAQAIEQAGALRPAVVLMDLKMPGVDGVAATRELAARHPEIAVLILTTYADDASLLPALRAGARGYLTKDASAEEIEAAIRAVHAGERYLDTAVQDRLIDLATQTQTQTPGSAPVAASPGSQPAELPDELTAREAEVLALIAEGLSNGEIAERLVVSAATVKTHVNRIFSKTGSRDRAQAVRYAYAHGLFTP
ncbi:MAG TPA: response regulator transcription factor [Solirubrobacteraceae bacterium]|nr:response regulator transcription factor [Solirubrobacteraceae bacterium]